MARMIPIRMKLSGMASTSTLLFGPPHDTKRPVSQRLRGRRRDKLPGRAGPRQAEARPPRKVSAFGTPGRESGRALISILLHVIVRIHICYRLL
jgi:hypothetical protein